MNMKRGITLVCKIMQNIANRVAYEKEAYMKYFNDFLRTNFDAGLKYGLIVTISDHLTEVLVHILS